MLQRLSPEEGQRRRRQLARRLREQAGEIRNLRAFVGFDGFVDDIVHVVATRQSPDRYTPMATLGELSQRIAAAAGLSTNLEFVVQRTKLGGNGPIMALALARLGMQVTCVGTLGAPRLHPVFQALEEAGVETISLGPPAHTDALEFLDGKLMLGKLTPLAAVDWPTVAEAVGRRRLVQLARDCHLIAQLNWTMLPHLTSIWEAWRQEMAPLARGVFFVDLADPAKRPLAQLQAALDTLGRLGAHQPVYLGVNWREALAVRAALPEGKGDAPGAPSPGDGETEGPAAEAAVTQGGTSGEPGEEEAARLARELGPLLAARGFAGVFIHPVRAAAAWRRPPAEGAAARGASAGGSEEDPQSPGSYEIAHIPGPYTAAPKLTTGAGDNFNAGTALGLCLRLPLPEVLWLGKATSGYYVRTGESPTLGELAAFLETWTDEGSS